MTEDKAPKVYVVGFLFDAESTNVLLHKKAAPEWQKGKLNGIGGTIMDNIDLTPESAMNRIFHDLTDLKLHGVIWDRFMTINRGEMESRDGAHTIHFFKAMSPVPLTIFWKINDKLKTSEFQVIDYKHSHLSGSFMPDLNWLIPMALSREDCRYECTAINLPVDYAPLGITVGRFQDAISKAHSSGIKIGTEMANNGSLLEELYKDTSVFDEMMSKRGWRKTKNDE